MNILTTGEVEMLVGFLVRYESVAKSAESWLTAEHLNELYGNQLPGLIWTAVLGTIQTAGVSPKTADFTKQLYDNAVANTFGDEADQSWYDTGHAAIDAMFAKEVDESAQVAARKMLVELNKKLVFEPTLARAADAARASGDWAEFDKIKARLTADSASVSQENIYADPFSAMDKIDLPLTDADLNSEDCSRLLTGTCIDALHKGLGPYRGLLSLVLGPTSGGKTTLVHNMIAECCALGHSVGYISTEEDLDKSDMAKTRLYAACTDIDTATWEAAHNDPRRLKTPLSLAQIDRIKRMRANTTFYSFAATPTWDDLKARILATAERLGKHHDIIFIDWAGPLSKVISDATNVPPHQCLEDIACRSQELAKETGIAVFLMHQLASEQVEKSKQFGPYTELNSQNCKKMAQYAGAVYILCPYDGNLRMRVIGAKLRADVKNKEIVVQLDPTHSRVTYLESFTVKGGKFRDTKDDRGPGEPGKALRTVRKEE